MSEQRLTIAQARAEGVSATAAAGRRARVERSRQRAQAAKKAADSKATAPTKQDEDEVLVEELLEDEVPGTEPEQDLDVVEESVPGTEAADDVESADEAVPGTSGFEAGEWDGSVIADEDGNGPETHPIKGNKDSMLYHTPESRYYKVTKAEVWFDTEEHAEAAGFSKPGSQQADEESN